MLRCLAILCITVGCLLWGQDASKHQKSSASTAANQAAQAGNPMPPPGAAVNPTLAAPPSKPTAPEKKQETPPKPPSWFLRPEWVIVWVTIVYTVLTGFTLLTIKRQADLMAAQLKDAKESAAAAARTTAATLKAIRRQAKSMRYQTTHLRRSAQAAQKSAEAAVGMSAPVLMLHSLKMNLGIGLESFYKYPDFRIEIKNYGGSPAFLKHYAIHVIAGELPEKPVYSNDPWPCDIDTVVDAGATHLLGGEEGRCSPSRFPDQEDATLISGKKYDFIVYGRIAYGDVFGSPLKFMKFSKIIWELAEDNNPMMMDWGGPEYTGQGEHHHQKAN